MWKPAWSVTKACSASASFGVSVSTPLTVPVRMEGDGLRIRSDVLKKEFQKGGQLQDLLLRCTQAFITRIAQGSACNRAHDADGRLAKWLLVGQGRSHSKELRLTHEFIDEMLGMCRAGFTLATGMTKQKGLIEYCRGHITILDRGEMETLSFECLRSRKRNFPAL